MNILYVTTRQWNPGDEFILAGVRVILKEVIQESLSVESIYNKSPQVRTKLDLYNPLRKFDPGRLLGLLDGFLRIGQYDNSFNDKENIDFYDVVVICGSPGWFGGRLKPLYKKLKNYRGKIIFIGIGSSKRAVKLSLLEKTVLERASYITCREPKLHSTLVELLTIPPKHYTCPAILASQTEAQSNGKVNRIGLIYVCASTPQGHRSHSQHMKLQGEVFNWLINQGFKCEIICNYQTEMESAALEFPNTRIKYRYDASEYVDLLSSYDLIVSSRVHGCGLSSSLTIPNLMIAHDERGGTVKGFGSTIVKSLNEAVAKVTELQNIDYYNKSKNELHDLKKSTLNQYISDVKSVF